MDGYLVLLRRTHSDEPVGLHPTLEAAREQAKAIASAIAGASDQDRRKVVGEALAARFDQQRQPKEERGGWRGAYLIDRTRGATVIRFAGGMPVHDENETYVPEEPKPVPKSRRRKARAADV